MRAAIFLFILLHASALAGSDLMIEEPLIRIVSSRDDLRQWCRIDGHYDACTTFIGFRVEATCGGEADTWSMQASAKFRPWVFLANLSRLSHENEHIQDVRESVKGYLSELEGLRFKSEGACRARIAVEDAAFGEAMRDFARRSNLAHHPRLAMGYVGQTLLSAERP